MYPQSQKLGYGGERGYLNIIFDFVYNFDFANKHCIHMHISYLSMVPSKFHIRLPPSYAFTAGQFNDQAHNVTHTSLHFKLYYK